MTDRNHHYFATCFYGWQTASTREEAIEVLLRRFRGSLKDTIRLAQEDGEPGAYVWSCRVGVPLHTEYDIEHYAPRGVSFDETRRHYVTNLTAKGGAYCTIPSVTNGRVRIETRSFGL